MGSKIIITTSEEISIVDHVCAACSQLSLPEMAKLAALVDYTGQDWELTIDLIRHFKALEQEYIKECEDNHEEIGDLSPLKIDLHGTE